MAPIATGLPNGSARHFSADSSQTLGRFSDIPSFLAIQVPGEGGGDETIEISLEELVDDPTELCMALEDADADKRAWMGLALAHTRQKKVDLAVDILHAGLNSLSKPAKNPKEKLGPLSLLCWLFLGKCRSAPRVPLEGKPEVHTKEHWLQAATETMNEAGHINPAFPPLYLARGVLYLLRASLQPPSKPVAPGSVDHSERVESLRLAQRCFEDAAKVSLNRNMLAVMGVARTQYSFGRFADALAGYQEVLAKMPHLIDPDPRIGVGCCLWQLGYKKEAHGAWERSLELNPESKIATILIGLYYLNESSNYTSKDPNFAPIYKKAMTEYTQKAFKLDKEWPLTCSTFGGYFTLRRAWPTVENLAKKAIELTDVNAIASDGWYLLARKEHYQDDPDLGKIGDFYGRADAARGGGDRGYIPARFGIAQVLVAQGDIDGAKFRLDKIIQSSKSTEAMMLLGALYAEEVFDNMANGNREDKSTEARKAIAYLEQVRLAWKDPAKKLTPDLSVLIYLAHLYEAEQPEKAFQCLQQVEKMNIDDLLEKEDIPKEDVDEETLLKMREELSPQLLNNLGCFQYQSEKHDIAGELFQSALNACVKYGEKDDTVDIDALVTTISYNLARTYEASGLLDEARQVYEGLLARHDDYTDARTRLAYIELRQNPTEDGPKAIAALNETDGSNLEVRAMLGWYLSRSKKRASNIADDQEQKHYKKTLLDYDKHDRYSLTGMGNLYSVYAREMRRSTDKERDKRSGEYLRAVGYFDKVLQLDSRNAYAAQGIAIALVEDKRDLTSAVQLFSKVKDTVRDSSVNINLGHVFCDLKQFTRSIENYEAALFKDRSTDPQVLACLGRVYLLKGKQDKSIPAMKSSLDYSRRALALAPQQIHFQFNIAFVQMQIAQLMYSLTESQRTLSDVQAAAEGLDEAIEALNDIANSKNPPYPKHDIEQRANMGRNTMRRQLERATTAQREFEEKNASRLEEARKAREAELKRREAERQKAEAAAAEHRRKIQEERHKMLQVSRELAEKRAEEERRKEEAEMTTDSETGERVRRKRKARPAAGKRKKKGAETSGSESEASATPKPRRRRGGKKSGKDSGTSGLDSTEEKQPKKRRKLARKSERVNDKFKSSEMVEDSDDDDDNGIPASSPAPKAAANGATDAEEDEEMTDAPPTTNGRAANDDDEDAPTTASRSRKTKAARRIEESDDEDEDLQDEQPSAPPKSTTAERAAASDSDDEVADKTARRTNTFADRPDLSMVDESVGAAGEEGRDTTGENVGEGYGI